MALKEYVRKRAFRATPEPPGRAADAAGAGLIFVVQRHEARRLHYDFRLEAEGVLKSWAVPKGIPGEVGEKRLAVMVEDHPLEYRSFHGVIPEGSYGAGTVEIWDEGRYSSGGLFDRDEDEARVAEGLRGGHLNIILEGRKLNGTYALVRFAKAGSRNWLLIKKHAAGRRPGVSEASPMPDAASLRPMLAATADQPFDCSGWIFEAKWDGYRALAEVRRKASSLYSRSGKDLSGRFPALAGSLERIPDEVILDGEIVVVDEKGVPRFQYLQNYLVTGQGQLVYFVFDILYARGRDLRALPLEERKQILAAAVPDLPRVRVNPFIEERGTGFFQAAVRQGLEGMMAKDGRSPYRQGERSAEWLKIKAVRRQEAVIGGFTEPAGTRRYFGALVLGVYEGDELKYIGHAGGGFDESSLAMVYRALRPRAAVRSPFKTVPETNTPVTWVRPELVCEVKFVEWTQDGRMRQPVFLGLRDDKDPRDVVREDAFAGKGTAAAAPAAPRFYPGQQPAERDRRYTNCGKVFWPVEGYTKGDVLDYYDAVAPVILPYLRDRPENLRRHPDGITGASFVQRDVAEYSVPPGIATAQVDHGNGEVLRTLVCQDRETLLYMANLGCIEINPWLSRLGSLDSPDWLVLDFDPYEAAFENVIEAVLATKEVLDDAGAPCFCKTSGATGMHVYVPLQARYTFEQSQEFAHLTAAAVHGRLPRSTSLVRSPAARRGRVYLDYLQNRRAQSVAAPYSVRPVPGAPVSAPLRWDEVKAGLDPRVFNLRSMARRLKECGDLWAGMGRKVLDMRQSLRYFEERYGTSRKG